MVKASQNYRRNCFIVSVGKNSVCCSITKMNASEEIAHFLLDTFEGDNVLGMEKGHPADKFHQVLNFIYFALNEVVDERLVSNRGTKDFDAVR